jgi:hypothetical protein
VDRTNFPVWKIQTKCMIINVVAQNTLSNMPKESNYMTILKDTTYMNFLIFNM